MPTRIVINDCCCNCEGWTPDTLPDALDFTLFRYSCFCARGPVHPRGIPTVYSGRLIRNGPFCFTQAPTCQSGGNGGSGFGQLLGPIRYCLVASDVACEVIGDFNAVYFMAEIDCISTDGGLTYNTTLRFKIGTPLAVCGGFGGVFGDGFSFDSGGQCGHPIGMPPVIDWRCLWSTPDCSVEIHITG